MAKSALEKAIEKQQKEATKNIQKKIQADKRIADKQQRETNKHLRLEARRTRAASIVNGQPTYSGMKIVDKTAEELIKILCDGFHG
jgi:transcription elongation GreA/GreB family factor